MRPRIMGAGLTVLIWCAGVACRGGWRSGLASGRSAQRVISLVPSLTDYVVALGASDRLVGRTDYDRDLRLASLPSVGGTIDPSVERIVSLRPDLVISWRDMGTPGVNERLERLGIPIIRVQVATLAGVVESVREVGRRLGIASKTDSALRALADTFAAIRRSSAGRRPISVFYLVQLDPPMTVGPGTFIDDLLTVAGGRNTFADALVSWPTVSLESIVRRDPDVVIWPRAPDDGVWQSDLRGRPGWHLGP